MYLCNKTKTLQMLARKWGLPQVLYTRHAVYTWKWQNIAQKSTVSFSAILSHILATWYQTSWDFLESEHCDVIFQLWCTIFCSIVPDPCYRISDINRRFRCYFSTVTNFCDTVLFSIRLAMYLCNKTKTLQISARKSGLPQVLYTRHAVYTWNWQHIAQKSTV